MTLGGASALPAGWTIELDPSARRVDGGRAVIGGAPRRLLRLTPAGARWLDDAVTGVPLGPATAERTLARRLVDAGIAHPVPPAGAGPARRDVAVVIPVRDMTEGLATTLAALGDRRELGEVVVVDDGSADPREVRRAAAGATVLRNERSLGPAAARERGWRATKSPIVVFVDAEIDAPDGPGWLDQLLPGFGDDLVGALAPRVRASTGRAPAALAAYERARSSLDLGPRRAPVRPGSAVPYVPTAVLAVRRAALETIGGFDPTLRTGEDVDLVWRLHAHGWRIRYEADVVVTHPTRSTFGGWLRQRVAYGTSAAPLARRHRDAVAPVRLSWSAGLAWGAVLAGRPVLAAAVSGTAAAALSERLPLDAGAAREATRLVVGGQLWAARQLADALRRPWWPLAALLAMRSRRARPALVAVAVVPVVFDAWERRPRGGLARFAALRLVDDVAYGAGVWIGCARERSVRALLPSLSR
jgi:mycofactocin system glycosyltransferase